MNKSPVATSLSPPHRLLRFRDASHAVHATYALDEVLTRTIAEVYSALDIGLSIVKQIITAHDGEVSLRCFEGEGTTVFFTLPLTAPPDASVL